jgi:predicted dehydrogenase
MGLQEAFAQRRDPADEVDLTPRTGELHVAVQGIGDWVQRTIRPQLDAVRPHMETPRGSPPRTVDLQTHYVGLKRGWPFPTPQQNHEDYYARDITRDVARLAAVDPDLVIIASPDYAHVDDVETWLGRRKRPRAIVVEKPFSDEHFEANRLILDQKRLNSESRIPILGIDHYNWYVAPYVGHLSAIDKWLGTVTDIIFHMAEYQPVDVNRLRSLGSGIGFDMGAHFLGVVSLFCELDTICDEPKVGIAKRHQLIGELAGRRFFAETAVEVTLNMPLRKHERPIRVYGRMGKALAKDAKFIEFRGAGNRFARIDLREKGHIDPKTKYPYGGIFTGIAKSEPPAKREGDKKLREFRDPYNETCTIRVDGPIPPTLAERPDWSRHGWLVAALADGDPTAWKFLVSTKDALEIIRRLEDIREQVVKLDHYAHAQTIFPNKPKWPLSV